MGALEDRLRQRAHKNAQNLATRTADYAHNEALEYHNSFIELIGETLSLLEELDWPVGVSPHHTGSPDGDKNHPAINWGIAKSNNQEIAYWAVYSPKTYVNGSSANDYRPHGDYILLKDGRVGYAYPKSVGRITIFSSKYEPVLSNNCYTFWQDWSIAGYEGVSSFLFNVEEYLAGLKNLQKNARKWTTP